jgi:hypothetical protein
MQALNLKKGFAESEIGGGLGSNLRRPATAKALPVYLQEPTYLRAGGSAGQRQLPTSGESPLTTAVDPSQLSSLGDGSSPLRSLQRASRGVSVRTTSTTPRQCSSIPISGCLKPRTVSASGRSMSLHTATRRQGRICFAGGKTWRDASRRATKAFYPALSLCGSIFSGVCEQHSRLGLAIVELELPGRRNCSPPRTAPTPSATAKQFHGEAIYGVDSTPMPIAPPRRTARRRLRGDKGGAFELASSSRPSMRRTPRPATGY